jgi:hypothetical protein
MTVMQAKLPFQLGGLNRVIEFVAFGQIVASLLVVVSVGLGFLQVQMLDAEMLRLAALVALALMAIVQLLMAVWMYRAAANGQVLVPDQRWIRPIWQVIWWVIPPFFLWQPYRGMSQIWNASVGSDYDLNGPAAPPVTLWWLLFLLGPVLAAVVAPASSDGSYVFALMLLFFVGSAASAQTIVKAVHAGQTEKATQGRSEEAAVAFTDVSVAKAPN